IEQPELVVALGSVLALGPTPNTGYPTGAVRQPMAAGPRPPSWAPPPGPGSPVGPGMPPRPGSPGGFGAAGLGAAGIGAAGAAAVDPVPATRLGVLRRAARPAVALVGQRRQDRDHRRGGRDRPRPARRRHRARVEDGERREQVRQQVEQVVVLLGERLRPYK